MLEAVEEQCADKSLHGDHLHWLPGKPSAQEHGPHDAWGWEGYQRAHCHGVTEESRKEDAKRALAREHLNARLAELQEEADVLQHRDAPDAEERSSGEQLAYMGTDAEKWAKECTKILRAKGYVPNTSDVDELLLGWFANALGAGETAGYSKGWNACAVWSSRRTQKLAQELGVSVTGSQLPEG